MRPQIEPDPASTGLYIIAPHLGLLRYFLGEYYTAYALGDENTRLLKAADIIALVAALLQRGNIPPNIEVKPVRAGDSSTRQCSRCGTVGVEHGGRSDRGEQYWNCSACGHDWLTVDSHEFH
jgi:hypothetical protein